MTANRRPKDGKYYDLVKLPHGHIPAPLIRLWSSIPLPVKAIRDEYYYCCPECGEPSFFKINYMCWQCQDFYEYNCGQKVFNNAWRRHKRRKRRKYFKEILKKIEYLVLPILALVGKAYYVESKRGHFRDTWES